MAALGDVIEIDEQTVLVLGQELNVAQGRPDVANALVHRVEDTLVVVDTGVTVAFRAALQAATRRVGDWSRAVVLTTHGHPDHVGNNDLADELGVPVEHFVPARDLDQMRDPAPYWVRSLSRIAGVVPLPAPPPLAGNKVVSLFQPLRPFACDDPDLRGAAAGADPDRLGPVHRLDLRRRRGAGAAQPGALRRAT